MKIGCKAVHLSKEPERLPVSEDVDTRGISSNIEDTNTPQLARFGVNKGNPLQKKAATISSQKELVNTRIKFFHGG